MSLRESYTTMAHPNRHISILILLILLVAMLLPYSSAGAQSQAVVQAVLFYRSTCSHCVWLVTQSLPPILEVYGDRLQIFYCDVSYPPGDNLFSAAIERFSIKNIGVPTIIVGNDVLIGTVNIEEKFPGIIDVGLAQGGLGWPDIPGLEEAFSTAGSMQLPVLGAGPGPSDLLPLPTSSTPSATTAVILPTPVATQEVTDSILGNFRQDPQGNWLAVIVLVGMIAAAAYGIVVFVKKRAQLSRARYFVPLLSVIGMGISAYLAYVEITLAEAMCGPVGNCNAVQSSAYARLFGILPIGIVGLGGYAAVLLAWLAGRFGRGRWTEWGGWALFGLTAGGLLFSIYLTFLEPFVIGATCLWCLGSAVVMTMLFLLNAAPGKNLYRPGGT